MDLAAETSTTNNVPTVSFPPPPSLAPIPAGYPPPPYPLQYPHYYSQPCKCEYANQIRYYNHRDKEFYYHNAMPFTTPDPGSSADQTQPTPPAQYPYPQFYDPYGPFVPPMAPVPPNFSGRPGVHHHGPYYYQESGFCELILVMLALLLWLYSFYRLYLVWQNTLNFSESSIQGPQGWDFLVTWIVERIRIKNLRVPGMSTRRRGATGNIGQSCLAPSESHPNSHPFDNCDTAEDIELGLRARDKKLDSNVDLGNAMNSEGFDYENPSLLVLENENNLSCPYEVHEQEKSSPGGHSLEMSFVSSQSQLKQYLSTACLEDKAELQDQQEDANTGGEKIRTVSELSDV